jgi:Hint domain
MATFILNTFFIVPPSPTQAPSLHPLLLLLAGDTVTGNFGISNPLPSDDPSPDAAVSLYTVVGSGPDGINDDQLVVNGNTITEASYGQNGTITPIEVVSPPPAPIPLVLDVQPDYSRTGTGSYLVRISLTIDNVNRTQPPPLLSQAAKNALNATTEQLDTLSRGFDIMNASNATATGLKSANWVSSTAANVANPQVGFANSVGQAALAVTDTIVGTVEEGGNPVPLVLGGISALYALTGVVTAALAADPPDGDYTEVYQLPAFTYHVPNGSTADNAILHDSYDFLADTLDTLVASERYQGASLAGDTGSAASQTDAFDIAQTASQKDAASVSADLTAFQAELMNDGDTDQGNSDGSLAAVQSEIATSGTTDPFLANLINEMQGLLGPSGAQAYAAEVASDAASLTAPPISGTVFSGIASAGVALTSYANDTLSCFLQGTFIRTATGEVPVERLKPRDRIVLARTDEDEAVIWIGRRQVDAVRHPDPRAVWPVRIAAGTFGAGQPYRDLFLSPDHAVYAMGTLVPVRHLIDGRLIVQVPMARPLYFHVELTRHEVLCANGLATESYLDMGSRAYFDDKSPVIRLFPDVSARRTLSAASQPIVAAIWEAKGAAPLVQAGHALAAARAVLTGASQPNRRVNGRLPRTFPAPDVRPGTPATRP